MSRLPQQGQERAIGLAAPCWTARPSAEQATATALGKMEMYEREARTVLYSSCGSSESLPRTSATKKPTRTTMPRPKNAGHASPRPLSGREAGGRPASSFLLLQEEITCLNVYLSNELERRLLRYREGDETQPAIYQPRGNTTKTKSTQEEIPISVTAKAEPYSQPSQMQSRRSLLRQIPRSRIRRSGASAPTLVLSKAVTFPHSCVKKLQSHVHLPEIRMAVDVSRTAPCTGFV